MTTPVWRSGLNAAQAQFETALKRCGFARTDDGWLGPIPVPIDNAGLHSYPKRFLISIPEDFPFAPPRVRTEKAPPTLTWHRGPEGNLCLYRPGSDSTRPWETTTELFERVFDWHLQAANGWPNDPGDPDLARYFARSGPDVVVEVEDFELLLNQRLVKVPHTRHGVEVWRFKPRPARSRASSFWATGADVGLLQRPIHDWKSIMARLDVETRRELERNHRPGRSGVLLLRYSREGTEGTRTSTIALLAEGRPGSDPAVSVLDLVDTSPSRLTIRGGADHAWLRHKTIAIVGLGAIGSFMADFLARSGVGNFILVDPDRLYPENCVRHLADRTFAPMMKVDAVAKILKDRHGSLADCRSVSLNPELAVELLRSCDLVIDATADASAHGLLEYMLEILNAGKLVKVALQRDGDLVRVDRIDGASRSSLLSPVDRSHRPSTIVHRDVGCGDPISPSPPWAAAEAAATGSRYAIDFLRPRMRRQLPDSSIDVLIPQRDERFQKIGPVAQ